MYNDLFVDLPLNFLNYFNYYNSKFLTDKAKCRNMLPTWTKAKMQVALYYVF